MDKLEDWNLDAQYSCCVTAHVPVTLGFWEAGTRKSLSVTGCQLTFRFNETSAMFQRHMERDRAGQLMASVLICTPPHTRTYALTPVAVATASLEIVCGACP